jgi:hypothetical protein
MLGGERVGGWADTGWMGWKTESESKSEEDLHTTVSASYYVYLALEVGEGVGMESHGVCFYMCG